MIFKTLEFIPSDISTTIDTLTTDLTAGKYDDILNECCFLTFTNKGLTLVKQDKTIHTNATIDLSSYQTKTQNDKTYVALKTGYSLVSDTEINRLKSVDNYNDTEIKKLITNLEKTVTDLNTTLTKADSDIIAKVDVVENKIPDVTNFITSDDVTSILTTGKYATENYVQTKISEIDFTPYLTSIPDEYITETELTAKNYITDAILTTKGYITNTELDAKNYITDIELNSKGYLTEHQSLANYALKSEIPTVPEMSFDTDGNLNVTINGTTKVFVPKEA